jgi:prepilin-type N-terminal cleavage/methylation domain-containing protein
MTTTRTTSPATPARRGGFTLIESLMSVLIVSGVLVAALGTVGAIGRARQAQMDRAAAAHLANQVMAEILQCYYEEPGGGGALGPDAGETSRAQFDDVVDYDGWQSATSPRLRDGTVMTDYARWKVSVDVRPARLSSPRNNESSETGLKRIRVQVSLPGGGTYEMLAVRAAGGAYEQTPADATTYLTYGGVAARVGERGKTVYGGSHPLNVKTSQ